MKKLMIITGAAMLATCGLTKAAADTVPAGPLTTTVTNTVTTVTNNVTTVVTTITTTTIVTATNAATPAGAVPAGSPGGPSAAGVLAAKVTPPAPPAKWESVATFGATVAKGNSDSVLLTGSVVTAKKTPKNEVSFGADAAYGEQSSVESVDRLHGFFQWNHLYNSRFYYYNRADALHDGIADIDYDFTLSPGAGYNFIKSTNTLLSAEVGPGLATERLGGIDDTYATLRISEKFDHKFNSQVHLWENVEFLPEIDKWQKYSINFEIGVETAITKTLSLKTMLQDSYVNLPAAGRKDNDVKLISGISYKF